MGFIKKNPAPALPVKKALWVREHPTHAGKLAVEVLDLARALAEAHLSYAPNS
jgi:hypothetical protein